MRDAEDIKRKASEKIELMESDRTALDERIALSKEKEAYVEELRKRYEDDRLDMLERELAAEKRKLSAEIKSFRKMEEATESARDHVRKKIEQVKSFQRERMGKPIDAKRGDRIWLYRLKKHGNVLREADKHGFILVEIDGIRVRVHGSTAMPPKDADDHRRGRDNSVKYNRPHVPVARDVRGMTFEEAFNEVDLWLADALVVGMPG